MDKQPTGPLNKLFTYFKEGYNLKLSDSEIEGIIKAVQYFSSDSPIPGSVSPKRMNAESVLQFVLDERMLTRDSGFFDAGKILSPREVVSMCLFKNESDASVSNHPAVSPMQLEEAAKEYVKQFAIKDQPIRSEIQKNHARVHFIEGAKWQSSQPADTNKGIATCKTCGIFVFTPDGKMCMNGHQYISDETPAQPAADTK